MDGQPGAKVTLAKQSSSLKGIGLSALGYSFFAVQDAIVKWLVADFAVPQILFARSIVIVGVALFLARPHPLRQLAASRHKGALGLRAAFMFTAWMFYYNAARHLGLAQLTTLYFAAPVFVVVLSILILKEKVSLASWLAVLTGFAGVVLAAHPGGGIDLVPAGMALFAAICWGCSVILIRLISRTESTPNQMLVTNGLFVIACAIALPFVWRTPDLAQFGLMLMLGLAAAAGQFVLYESFRYAPASVIAPIEYSGLVWAFLFGFVVWGEVPATVVFLGAGLIVASSLALLWYEGRRASVVRSSD